MNQVTHIPGQRWISETEPELGLGTILKTEPGRLTLLFPASGEIRDYARDNAPLKRVRFEPGDRIQDQEGRALAIERVVENEGLLTYSGKGWEIPEAKLSDAISFSKPQDRLINGYVDGGHEFDVRFQTLSWIHDIRKSRARGFAGARVQLIPHQLFVAHEVSERMAPRVLLADEVGLGKTIEACLILQRLALSGRVSRALILVPESLVHQWFIELLRRFHLWFSLFDEERCAAIEEIHPEANPFLDDQFVLCGIQWAAESERRSRQLAEAGWDLLIVDEAHHLEWRPEAPSPGYRLAETLAQRTESLLLLTATPEQLGQEGHFARLKLLDPDRYQSLESYIEETAHYREVAQAAEQLSRHGELKPAHLRSLKKIFKEDSDALKQRLNQIENDRPNARRELLSDLLDRHGPGRVIFRNTRHVIQGFPARLAHLIELEPVENDSSRYERLANEFLHDTGESHHEPEYNFDKDARVRWLERFIRNNGADKALLICRTRAKAEAVHRAITSRVNVKTGIFHEGLTLLQRDRNAAWFADEEGAQLLICSEIGSEGRNFQFARHLVLFDLPLDPELVEQRIGRLDRIGQTREIQIHLPFLKDGPQSVVARWYHQGLDAIERHYPGGHSIMKEYARQLSILALDFHEMGAGAERALKELISQTKRFRIRQVRELEKGRDRLLEMSSFQEDAAHGLVRHITGLDDDPRLERFMMLLWDLFGLHIDDLGGRNYRLSPEGMFVESLPGLPEEGMVATFDRSYALHREEVSLLSIDHPLVLGSMEMLQGSERGNSSFGVLSNAGEKGILLECVYVLETVAPGALHTDRFMPPTPVRAVADQGGADLTERFPVDAFQNRLTSGPANVLFEQGPAIKETIPQLLESAGEIAERRAKDIRLASIEEMNRMLSHEIERMTALQNINHAVRPEEIELMKKNRAALQKYLSESRLRLDSVRLVLLQ